MARQKKDLETLVQENYPDFYKEVQTVETDHLNTRLATLSKGREEVLESKENDEALEDAKEQVAAMTGPYRDALKAIGLKSKYIIKLLKDRGAV